jgi:hypothetical protein
MDLIKFTTFVEKRLDYKGQLNTSKHDLRNVNVLIIIIIIASFMQSIRTYVPEANHVSRVHCVAAIPRVLLMVHITLSSILNSSALLH